MMLNFGLKARTRPPQKQERLRAKAMMFALSGAADADSLRSDQTPQSDESDEAADCCGGGLHDVITIDDKSFVVVAIVAAAATAADGQPAAPPAVPVDLVDDEDSAAV